MTDTGCFENTGTEVTVRIAIFEITSGEHVPLIRQRYCLLFKPDVTSDILRVSALTPEYTPVLLRFHIVQLPLI